MRRLAAVVLPLLLLMGGAWAEADEEVELTAAMHNNKVKWESHIRLHDQPLHATPVEDHAVIPLTVRATRRKRCSCGCQGCDLFPNRPCCSAACCSSAPMPLACCPPPPPPKPCCQPAFGPCCPATPNCCDKPCCKGRRPEWEDEEEEEGGAAPSQPPSGEAPRACCPASSPPPPPPSPPPPPPPPPEPPVECCGGDDEPKDNPCDQMRPNPCGRPCCYYQNPSCCDQNAGRKPCCPPQQPCCPELPPLPAIGCCSVVPPCLRACPTCPCRKRVMLGKRAKRDDGLHCQACPAPKELQGEHLGQHLARSPKTAYKKLEPESDLVLESPRAGKLFQQSREERARRVKRMNCQICLNGQPIIRKKRSLDCVACTYLQPAYPQRRKARAAGLLPHELFGDDDHSPVGVPLVREKRDSCLPHPQCTMSGMVRRYKRNLLGSQYCEPCGGHYGRKKREAERETCLKEHRERTKRAALECDRDEFDDDLDRLRMKRQAYQPNGLLDVAKLLTKSVAASQAGPGGCLRFPACVMAKKRRRKRQADRMEQYHKAVAEHKVAVAAHEQALVRHKRQFFTPDQSASCVPCPAWVTLALASRKKRSADNSTIEEEPIEHRMSLSEAIQDIRRKEGYELGFEEEEKDVRRKPRRRHGSCQQTEDCLNEVEYAIFRKVYHNHKRVKRSSKKKCTQCGHGTSLAARVKRSFGPDTNASEHACMAFPQCRTRVKRTIFNDCNICTPNLNRRRKKRNFGTPQCYPCNPGE